MGNLFRRFQHSVLVVEMLIQKTREQQESLKMQKLRAYVNVGGLIAMICVIILVNGHTLMSGYAQGKPELKVEVGSHVSSGEEILRRQMGDLVVDYNKKMDEFAEMKQEFFKQQIALEHRLTTIEAEAREAKNWLSGVYKLLVALAVGMGAQLLNAALRLWAALKKINI